MLYGKMLHAAGLEKSAMPWINAVRILWSNADPYFRQMLRETPSVQSLQTSVGRHVPAPTCIPGGRE
jgi:hypothetical protein